jgi:predicted RNase H-like HicB family nuclease
MSEWKPISEMPENEWCVVWVPWKGCSALGIHRTEYTQNAKLGWKICFTGGYSCHVKTPPSHFMALPSSPTHKPI